MDVNVSGLLILYFAFIKYFRKSMSTVQQCISYVYTSGKCMIFMCVIPVVCLTNKDGGVVKQHN